MPQHHDHDDLAALDFSSYQSVSDDADVTEADALDFSAADDNPEGSAVDALYEYAPAEHDETETELDAIHSATEAPAEEDDDEDDGAQLFTVTNPPETVSVSALMDGRTQRVHLSPRATNMTESELAAEILVLSDLARQKGLAGQHSFLVDNDVLSQSLHEMGIDDGEVVRGFMDNFVHLPTAEQAEAAQAEVFAARYATDK